MQKRRKRTNSNIPAKGRLRDIADRLWSHAVRNDWAWECAVCRSGKVEAHHIIPRQQEATRYDLRNGIALCTTHHKFDSQLAPHQNSVGWCKWLQENYPCTYVWVFKQLVGGNRFSGTKNAAYLCDVIRGLRQYVEPEDFERIVGVRFSQWLAEN